MTGIYFLANDRVLELSIAFLNSVKTFEPELPVCFIPFDSDIGSLLRLSEDYGFSVWSDGSVLQRCDAISRQFHSDTLGQYRKLAIWEGQYEQFVYIDVDTILLSSLEAIFPLLREHDVITGVSNLESIRRFVWSGDATVLLPELDVKYAANTGFIASKRGILSLQMAETWLNHAMALKNQMELDCAEQPFLNYLIVTSGMKYTSLSQLRRNGITPLLPKQVWAGSFDEDLLVEEALPLLIHWAGRWQRGDHLKSSIWQHFRALRGGY
jgi:hypothetical protein